MPCPLPSGNFVLPPGRMQRSISFLRSYRRRVEWPLSFLDRVGHGPAVPHESNLPYFLNSLDHGFAYACQLGSTPMPQKILDVLLLGRCSHEFSWPRRAADGEYYQVCLLCATEFRYDWSTMRRTERLKKDAEPATAISKRRAHSTSSWVPRARRIKMDAPLRYRVKNLGTWNEGIIENLSQSGVLIGGQQRFPENTLVE